MHRQPYTRRSTLVSGRISIDEATEMAKPKRKTLTLKNPEYQPSKAELEEEIKIDVPGDTPEEKMKNLTKAVLQPAEIRYRD